MTQNNDSLIIRNVLSGNIDAYEQLVTKYQNSVYSHALNMMQDPQDAMDASQEAFLKAYSNLRSYRQESSFSVWLHRITHNCCIDMLRRRQPTVPVTDENGLTLEIPDFSPGPEEAVEKSELHDAVRNAAARLPQEFREVLMLREFTGLSYAEIAQILDIEPATVKTRIFRARKKMAEIFRRSGNFFDTEPSDTMTANSSEGGSFDV